MAPRLFLPPDTAEFGSANLGRDGEAITPHLTSFLDNVPGMSEPTPIAVPADLGTLEDVFPGIVGALRDARLAGEAGSSLTEREIELVRLGVMIALDAPQASFTPHVERALAGDVTRNDVMAVAAALATIVGVPKLLATLPKLAKALGS